MTLALSDMSPDALRRELRIAQARGLSARVKAVKRELARRRGRLTTSALSYTLAPLKHWSERDD